MAKTASPTPTAALELIGARVIEDEVVRALCEVIDVSDVQNAAKALLTVARREKRELALLRALLAHEFAAHASRPAEILRDQTLASRALGLHAKRIGVPFLQQTLGAPDALPALALEPHALELDPARLAPDEASSDTSFLLEAHTTALSAYVGRLVDALTSPAAREALPTAMRQVLVAIGECADARIEPLEPRMRNGLLGGYVILRFVNPAVVSPDAFGLLGHGTSGQPLAPSGAARRSLVLLAKALQAAANGTVPREAFMAPLTPAIAAATVRLDAFFTRLAAREPSEPQRGGNGSSGEGDDGDALIPSEDVEEALGTLACLIHQRRDKLLPLLPAADAASIVHAAAEVSAWAARQKQQPQQQRARGATTATAARSPPATGTAADALPPKAKRSSIPFEGGTTRSRATTMAAASAAAVAEAATRAKAAVSRAFQAVMPEPKGSGSSDAAPSEASQGPRDRRPSRRILSFDRLRRRSTAAKPTQQPTLNLNAETLSSVAPDSGVGSQYG